jgi:WD40 repeat protein
MTKTIPVLGISILVAAAVSMAWWWNTPARFPIPKDMRPPTAQAVRALPPATPSISSLPIGRAIPIPGFEKLTDCYSLCLSPDLKQIYFGRSVEPKTGMDLYVASRESVEEPFGTPVVIESTVSPETDAYPAISPDGLELYFVRSDANPMIWVTRRTDPAAAFGKPEKWTICQEGDTTSRVGTPQVISADRVIFSRINPERGTREVWGCQRTSGTQFSNPELYSAPAGNPTVFFNPDGQRAYYGGVKEGFFLLWRPNLTAPLSAPDKLLNGEATGPIDGTIWVAPQEDALFYCSPGPGQSPGSGRKFWVIGF